MGGNHSAVGCRIFEFRILTWLEEKDAHDQVLDAMREATNDHNGGAGRTAAIRAGMGIGNIMTQALQGSQQLAQPQKPTASAVSVAGMPAVRTSVKVVAMLHASAEDGRLRSKPWT